MFGTPAIVSRLLQAEKRCIPQRYIVGLLGFMALSNAYIQRFHAGLTITEMTAPIYHNLTDANECPAQDQQFRNSTYKQYDFKWNEKTQGLILGSVFWGYVLTQIPGGWIAERYGGKHTLGFGMLCSIVGNIVTPLMVSSFGSGGFIVIRILVGLGQGPVYPSVNVLLSHWAPLHERGRLGAMVFAGAQIGNVVSMAVTGFIINHLGWQSVFYIYGIVGLIWYAFWLLLVSDTPASNRFISDGERQYLAENVMDIAAERKNLPQTPWKKILSSSKVWGLIAAQVGHDWGLFTIAADLPKYMKQVLHYSVAKNGLLSAIPHLCMWLSALVSGFIVDSLIKKKCCTTTAVRKIFVTIAATGPAIGIMAASYAGCDRAVVITCFTIGMSLMGAFVPSLKVNPLDLSPNFAGSLMALVGGVGAFSGILAPAVVGGLTTNGTLLEWRQAFWVASVVLIVTNIIYIIFGTGKVQLWNDVGEAAIDGGEDNEEAAQKNSSKIMYSEVNGDAEGDKISLS